MKKEILLLVFILSTVSMIAQYIGLDPNVSLNRYNLLSGSYIRQNPGSGDVLGSILFKGLTAAPDNYTTGAAIRSIMSDGAAGTYLPANLSFMTGAEALQTRLLIGENGYLSVNKTDLTARFAIRHFSDAKVLNNVAFEVEGGASNAVKKFSLYNEGTFLNAALSGNMYVKEGDIEATDGNVNVQKGNINAPVGSVNIGRDFVTTDGDVNVQNGNITVPKGKVIIGSDKIAWDYTLSVNGGIAATEVRIAYFRNWPDYVFLPHYQLKPLAEVAQFIQEKGHLPGIPSAQEVAKEGFEVAAMQQKLLEKIEELTLYIIQQQKEIEELKKQFNKSPNGRN